MGLHICESDAGLRAKRCLTTGNWVKKREILPVMMANISIADLENSLYRECQSNGVDDKFQISSKTRRQTNRPAELL